MGVASLVIGIIAVLLGFIPFCGIIALIPAIVGVVLGIVDWVKKSKQGQPKGMSIAGTILSSIAVVIIIVWYALAGILGLAAVNEIGNAIESTDWNEVSSYSSYY